MAYCSSVHESTGFSPYRLMFGEECTLPMDVGMPRRESDLPDPITSPYAVWVRDALEMAYDQVRRHRDRRYNARKDYVIGELSDGCLPWGIGFCIITPRQRSANLTLHGSVRIWLCPWQDGLLGFSDIRIHPLSWYIARI